MVYKEVKASADFPEIEKNILKFWEDNSIFKQHINKNGSGENGSNEFVFYDGPPFANGLPHYGHLLTGYVKDVIPRFHTMCHKRVDRRFGWDTHGLPAELEAQKELGIEDVNEIKKLGILKFNQACQKSVLKYTHEWEEYVTRQARWVDFENDYKTLDINYMESVLWAFSQLYSKGLAYKGYKVLPYCWQDQTPLSNHELRMDDDVYQTRQDNTVTVGMKIDSSSINNADLKELIGDNSYVLVWTTTPWTLPTNFAIAVGAQIKYSKVTVNNGEFAGKSFIIASSRVDFYKKELGEDFDVVEIGKGQNLEGIKYFPIFDYFKPELKGGINDVQVDLRNAYTFKTADYVGEGDGTGLVHIAPYGEDDMLVLSELKVVPPVPMTQGAILTEIISDYKDLHVFDSNKEIIRDLREGSGPLSRIEESKRALLFRTQSLAHSYPHCWRCRQPLIYRPISSWFVDVSKIKDRMLELNDKINWIPQNVKYGQFGKWLEGARDWAISRNRYWGAPIPVWVSDDPKYPRVDVYGSISQMEEDFSECLKSDANALKAYPNGKVDDLHRPKIDTLWRYNPDDPTKKSKMKRITDVFDCWFESGSMPFAQVHYPFENKQWFEDHYPSDFIVEYIGQTRGWFYTLHIMATALFDCNAYKNVMCHGIVLGEDGQKMSKSLRNYPSVSGVFDKYGSDAMRWFLLSSSILRGGNLSVKDEAIHDTVRQTLLPIWSSYFFFTLYANSANNAKGYQAKKVDNKNIDSLNIQDQYILAKMHDFLTVAYNSLEDFDIAKACEATRDIVDVLTNWYIRTNRERFWNEDTDAFDTLYTVLECLMRAVAPLLPLISEEIWKSLTLNQYSQSVHLEDYPIISGANANRHDQEIFVKNDDLVKTIDEVREIVSSSLSIRKAHNIRVRQPLANLKVAVTDENKIKQFVDVLKSQINVKNIELFNSNDVSKEQFGIEEQIKVNARALGPRICKKVQQVIMAAKNGKYQNNKVFLDDEIVELFEGEYEKVVIVKGDSEFNLNIPAVLSTNGYLLLNLELTDDLVNEGYARDLIREIQEIRKQSGLLVGDRINLTLNLEQTIASAADQFGELISNEVLAVSLTVNCVELVDDNSKIVISKA